MLRRIAHAASLGLVAVLLAGCSGSPAPAASTPGFASEEEAFAAAEDTYRAYIDALNQVDLADPATFEAVYAFTSGQANTDEKKTLTQMYADGWVRTGATKIVDFFGDSLSSNDKGDRSTIQALACVDVRDAGVVDADGTSQTSTSRPDILAIQLTFQGSNPDLLIDTSIAIEDTRCA